MACVGHTSMQDWQVPQCDSSSRSIGKGTSTKISPRKKVEPDSRLSNKVCLPRQPKPALRASSTSIKGAESVKTR